MTDKYGFIDKTGRFVINPKYDNVGDFHEGLAYASYQHKYGFIDKTGNFVIEPRFEITQNSSTISHFQEGLASVYYGGKWGYIDRTGRFVIEPKFYEAYQFADGIALADCGFRKCGLIDRTGKFIVQPIFNVIRYSRNGLFPTQFEKNWGFIDKTGKFVIEPKYDICFHFHNEMIAHVKYNGKSYLIDKTGKIITGPYDDMGIFCGGLIRVKKNGKWGFMDNTGKFVIEPKYEEAGDFSESDELACVKYDNKNIVIDKSGKIVFEPNGWVCYFQDGIAKIIHDDKYGLIDKTGKIIVEPKFYWINNFFDGIARADINGKGKYCFIDKTGKIIREVLSAGDFHEGLACVRIEVESQTTKNPPTPKPQPRPYKPQKQKSGCYIASSVYGSYNCPQVWTLRRFRDNTLDETWYGRAFIKTYYAISPTLVKWFGETNWFKKLWRKPLDKWVKKLNEHGLENTPYNDKY